MIKFLASLKLAVVIMVGLAILIAWGTIVESRYDAYAAKKIVYDTWMMYGLMGALSISLIAVMVDRWPWKKRHVPFLLAHVGILILLLGSVLTAHFGLDGMMSIPIQQSSRHVTLTQKTDLMIYASFGGQRMSKIHQEEVDFFKTPPTAEKPHVVTLADQKLVIKDYKKYALPSRRVEEAKEGRSGPALRFQISSSRFNVVEWLVQTTKGQAAKHDFGPAMVFLGEAPEMSDGTNQIWFTPLDDKSIRWSLFNNESHKVFKTGIIRETESFKPGWMDAEIRVLRFYPQAREKWELEERDFPTPLTTAAIFVQFAGHDQWILLNDTVRFFVGETAYLISYLNRRIDLGFDLFLKSFEMIPYEGTQKAKEYMSHVILPGVGEQVISMNNPAYYQGLTIYQASFQNDEQGKPIASVFSINHDPGRWIKYLGSLIISLGVIWLFLQRKINLWRQKKESP